MDPARITLVKDDYLADIELDYDKEPEKPRKKTKAEKRAEAKEKKRLAVIEEKKLIMRDELRRELELSKRVESSYMKEWEEMCKEVKVAELRLELLSWAEQAKRNFERKNETMEFLVEDLARTHEQQSRMFGRTIEIIDYLGRCFLELVKTSKYLYESQAEEILRDYYAFVKRCTEELGLVHEQTQNVTCAHDINIMNTMKEDYKLYELKRDDVVNTGIEDRFQIRDEAVKKMKLMHQQLITFVNTLTNTELDAQKYERIRWLSDRQAAFTDESRILEVEVMKCKAIITDLHRELRGIVEKTNAKIKDLKLEQEYFSKVRKSIEKEILADRTVTHEKIKVLTTKAYDVKKEFEKFKKTGELMLSLSVNCRKLQTQAEKIVLGGETPALKIDFGELDESFKIEALDLQQCIDVTEEEILNTNKCFDNFVKRQSMVQVQNLKLQDELRKLTEENEKYIKFIKTLKVSHEQKELMEYIKINRCPDHPPEERQYCMNYSINHRQSKFK